MQATLCVRSAPKRACPESFTSSDDGSRKCARLSMSQRMARVSHHAFGIIYFPGMDKQDRVYPHMKDLASKQLVQRYQDNSQRDIPKVEALTRLLTVFSQDYLSKATSPHPTRAFLFLPSVIPGEHRPYFKNRVTGETTFGVDKKDILCRLSEPEQERLVSAFLEYEMVCQTLRPRLRNSKVDSCLSKGLLRCKISYLKPWEQEGILCVHEYVKSLYGAMFTHCSGSWLPDVPEAASKSTGLMFPDNVCFSPSAYLGDMNGKMAEKEAAIIDRLALFGLDLVVKLLSSTQQNSHLQLREWFDFFEEEYETSSSFPSIDDVIPTPDTSNEVTGGPAQWVNLCRDMPSPADYHGKEASYEEFVHLQRTIFRQRGWAFFDHERLYPGNHFPGLQDLQDQSRALHRRVMNTLTPRFQRRSQKWRGDRPGVGRPETGEAYRDLEEVPVTPIPRFFDEVSDAELGLFWE